MKLLRFCRDLCWPARPWRKGRITPPIWAYPVLPPAPGSTAKPDDTVKKSLPDQRSISPMPGSATASMSPTGSQRPRAHARPGRSWPQTRRFLPAAIATWPNGQGRPENASLAGQPAAYILEQVMEMKAGRRKTSQPTMGSIKSHGRNRGRGER